MSQKLQPSGIPAELRLAEARDNKLAQLEADHPAPSEQEMARRWSILTEAHNMLMLRGISRLYVDSAADRAELLDRMMMELSVARTGTKLAEAVTLLDSEDGRASRASAHRVIRNMARTQARSMRTVRDREISNDFSAMQVQAVIGAYKADGPWHKKDKDSSTWINQKLAETTNDGQMLEWKDRDFHRRAEQMQEQSDFWSKNSRHGPATIHLYKEATLDNLLTDAVRIRSLHDYGRLDRADAWTLKDWYHRFSHMDVDWGSDMYKLFASRAKQLGSNEMRQGALLMLVLMPGATNLVVRNLLVAIVRGEINTLGKLAQACTKGTVERKQKRSSYDYEDQWTKCFMEIDHALMLRMLGLDWTRSRLASLSNLLKDMAMRAGASVELDKDGRCQHKRFPCKDHK